MQTIDHKVDHTLEPEAFRRVEIVTGVGRRRRFSADQKAQIVSETLVRGAVISEVARRHGLAPQQVFCWRRDMRCATQIRNAGVCAGAD